MSTLVENVEKVKSAHAALSASIEAKGVSVPAGTKLTGMPALVDQIETGGSVEPTNDRAVFTNDTATSLVVPNMLVVDMASMTDLNQCFYDCQALTSLTLPAGFGQNATNLYRCFSGCDALTSLTLPDGFGQNATNLAQCFANCEALKYIALPAGFGQNATNSYGCFSYCQALTSLTLPDGFGQNATNLDRCFEQCIFLNSITFPDGFGQNATSFYWFFYNCYNLNSLHLPTGFGQASTNNVMMFYYCSGLTTITGNPNFKVSLELSPCQNLTHDSIMVVINGLQTVTETQTLKLGETNLAKLTDEEKQIATDKGWTLA